MIRNLFEDNMGPILRDLYGNAYRFTRWRFADRPPATDCVYAFVNAGAHVVLYIGETGDLSARLSSHETKIAAMLGGADELWVHQPTMLDLDYRIVEARLIEAYRPRLNRQQPNPGGVLGHLSGETAPGTRPPRT
jgi:hypothetical protein